MTTMRIICLTILFVIHLQAIFICAEDHTNLPLHKRMDPSLLKQTFHVESYDEVPAYEVVQVRPVPVRSRRSADNESEVLRVHLSAFGRDIQLQLHKNHDFDARLKTMKMYMAENTNNGIQYEEMAAEDDDPGTPYQDLDQMAAVIIRVGSDGEIQMEGTIGNDLVVKPVPTALLVPEDNCYDEIFSDEDESYEHTRHRKWPIITSFRPPHFVYREKISSHSDYLLLDSVRGGHFNPSRRTKRAVPPTVYPEILILLDYQSFVLHGNCLKGYVASFWNAVDLRFKTISSPEIRISLAGVIVAKDKNATPFLEHNRLPSPNHDAFAGSAALDDIGKYMYLERSRLPAYDLAVFMTKLDMCSYNYGGASGSCNRKVDGWTYLGGACLVDKMRKKVMSVAIIEDSGEFSGISAAAHEVGHLLGSMHDGDFETPLGGPEATRCPRKDGFIMDSPTNIYNHGLWSNCSVEQFKHFFSTNAASCLFNIPDVNKLLNSTHVKPTYKPPTTRPLMPQQPQEGRTEEVAKTQPTNSPVNSFANGSSISPTGTGSAGPTT